MNGRIYDPVLGQFMQPDNFIQTPEDYIGYDRYSYCRGNPFKFTDPSGEDPIGSTRTGSHSNSGLTLGGDNDLLYGYRATIVDNDYGWMLGNEREWIYNFGEIDFGFDSDYFRLGIGGAGGGSAKDNGQKAFEAKTAPTGNVLTIDASKLISADEWSTYEPTDTKKYIPGYALLWAMYAHFETGDGSDFQIDAASLDFSFTSQEALGLADILIGDKASVNLRKTIGLHPFFFAFGKIDFIRISENQFTIVNNDFDFNYEKNGSMVRNTITFAGSAVVFGRLWNTPMPILGMRPNYFIGGKYTVRFNGSVTIPRR